MFIVDDILKFPFTGLMFIVKEIANAAAQEQAQQRTDLMAELTSLHRRLESGEISEDEFDEQEEILLDRLEQMDAE